MAKYICRVKPCTTEVNAQGGRCPRCSNYVRYHAKRMIARPGHWVAYSHRVSLAYGRHDALADDITNKRTEIRQRHRDAKGGK